MSSIIAANYLRRGARRKVRKVAHQVARRAAVVAATSLVKHRRRRHRNRNRKSKSTSHLSSGTALSIGKHLTPHPKSIMKIYNTHNSNFNKNNYVGNLKQMWLDPFNCNGVTRIADDSIQPTAVMTLTHRNIIAASSNGVTSYIVVPNPNYGIFNSSGATVGSKYVYSHVQWAETSTVWPNGLGVNGIIDRFRCVSMGVRLTCTDTSTNSKGMLLGACVASDEVTAPVWSVGDNTWESSAQVSNYVANSKFLTAPGAGSLYVKWIPSTPLDYEYKNPLLVNTDYTNFTSTPFKNQLFVGAMGCAPSQNFMIEVVSHWEWIPVSTYSLMVPVSTAAGKTEETEKLKDWFRERTDTRCVVHPRGTTTSSVSTTSSSSSSQGVLSPWGGIDYITKLPSGEDSSKTYPKVLSALRALPSDEFDKLLNEMRNSLVLSDRCKLNKLTFEKERLEASEKRASASNSTPDSNCSGECVGCDASDCQYWDHEGTTYIHSLVETIRTFIKKGDKKTAEALAETTREQLKTCRDDSTHKFLDGLITSSLV